MPTLKLKGRSSVIESSHVVTSVPKTPYINFWDVARDVPMLQKYNVKKKKPTFKRAGEKFAVKNEYFPSYLGHLNNERDTSRVERTDLRSYAQLVKQADKVIQSEFHVDTFVKVLLDEFVVSDDDPQDVFAKQYLKEEILSKYISESTAPAEVRWAAAVKKLISSEASCKKLNEEGFDLDGLPHGTFDAIMQRARCIIGEAVGLKPNPASLFQTMSFGSGATVCRKRTKGDPYFKYNTRDPISVTQECYRYARATITATPLWAAAGGVENLYETRGNVIFSVLKKVDEDRLAAKEAAANAALQNPVGKFFRRALKRLGVDLTDQDFNKLLAKIGSRDGSLSTLDLKSASDSISQRLVFELFPIDWVTFLDELRSTEGFLPSGPRSGSKSGEWFTWEKHSTMGNGYTFELESLIFYALVKAARDWTRQNVAVPAKRHVVNIYGDDIICPSYSSSLTVKILNICGFTTNEKKSFVAGPFRESCGGHYYNGYDVSPFYIRSPVNSVSRMIWLLNTLKRYLKVNENADPRFENLWLELKRKYVPRILWGGKNSKSVCALHTYDEPRLIISRIEEKRSINGVCALLRNFQFNQQVIPFDNLLFMRYGVTIPTWSGKTDSKSYKQAEERLSDMAEITGEVLDNTEIVVMGAEVKYAVKHNFTNSFEEVYYPVELGATRFGKGQLQC